MGALYHSPLFERIREYFQRSHQDDTLFLFVPYIKTDVLESLLEGIPNKTVIVTTWEPGDIQTGSSELSLYSGDHKFVQNNAAFLLANLSMSRVNLAVL